MLSWYSSTSQRIESSKEETPDEDGLEEPW